jgi:hypothetical protein
MTQDVAGVRAQRRRSSSDHTRRIELSSSTSRPEFPMAVPDVEVPGGQPSTTASAAATERPSKSATAMGGGSSCPTVSTGTSGRAWAKFSFGAQHADGQLEHGIGSSSHGSVSSSFVAQQRFEQHPSVADSGVPVESPTMTISHPCGTQRHMHHGIHITRTRTMRVRIVRERCIRSVCGR